MVARPDPGSATFSGTATVAAVDDDGDGVYDRLVLAAGVSVTIAGDYQLMADLWAGGRYLAAMASPVTTLTAGTQTLALGFPAGLLRQNEVDGPYEIRRLVLRDMAQAGVQTAAAAGPYTSAAYGHRLFAPGLLRLDRTIFTGQSVRGAVTVVDAKRNADTQSVDTLTVKVTSPMDPDGIILALQETGAATGVFTGSLGFSLVSSNAPLGIVKVRDQAPVQVFYDGTAPDDRWVAGALWETDRDPGDLSGDGQIGLADAILVLKLMTGASGGVDADYLQSEVRASGSDRLGMVEAVYILQKTAGIR